MKVRGASGRALGRGGSLGPATLSTENPDLATDPLITNEPHKISRNQTHSATRNRELVSLTTEQTDGSATRDREVVR